jgi:hypothetical protein
MNLMRLFVLFFCLALTVTGCSKSEGDRTTKEQDFINTAIKEARKLDYPVENMDIKLKKKGNEILVYFSPKYTNEENIALGGDLTIYIDSNNGKVVKVERGQ